MNNIALITLSVLMYECENGIRDQDSIDGDIIWEDKALPSDTVEEAIERIKTLFELPGLERNQSLEDEHYYSFSYEKIVKLSDGSERLLDYTADIKMYRLLRKE